MRRFVLTLALLTAACGCARPDWIQSTLVTVDVSGTCACLAAQTEVGDELLSG